MDRHKSKGGRQGQAVIDKIKSTTYKLNSAGYKRKVEHDLESEKKSEGALLKNVPRKEKTLLKTLKRRQGQHMFFLEDLPRDVLNV